MSHTPAYYHDISIKLSGVLEDIGVNEHTVKMRRRLVLLMENITNVIKNLSEEITQSQYFFGSQTEGTTTLGLHSDIDMLFCDHRLQVLQDISEWTNGAINLLMFQDEYTAPGYYMLHSPFDNSIIPDHIKQLVEKLFVKLAEKMLLKNSFMHSSAPVFINNIQYSQHGPSLTTEYYDSVFAIQYKTLPNFVSTWLKQQLQKGRLTSNMKRYIECHPCYVVPVGCKGSPKEELEWRISTSHAERCVMFNLNITQIQCYVMFKFMLDKDLKHPSEQGLSSFMCKNIVLLCIEDTDSDDWCPDNLLSVFKLCLLQLEHCVSEEYCPHFIMNENNLMAGKFKPEVKLWLLDKIQTLYKNIVSYFLRLTTDKVGITLNTKLGNFNHNFHFENPEVVSRHIFCDNLYFLVSCLTKYYSILLNAIVSGKTTFNSIILKAIELYRQGDSLKQAAILLVTPLIYSSLGSVIAARNIEQGKPVSPEALVWLSLGLNSDVTSGRLKLASVYYCTGDYSKAEAILKIVEDNYDTSKVDAICFCKNRKGKRKKKILGMT